mmetsp:Transcript_4333/g.7234  ORF Transcript_4333/g.7234 Transcript_4333/m.7234 type:complete len:285 (+) Transcript_4333:46-900(+)|eukprot:CAMPEP_0119014004 /NCGR_PEP_ID=MMETSP1176-20130426/9302_1 /TAXON_ID=265551 /ORGANISM="Synedropsis recta cf, Strain CCMP1620" /LENGTH=284 /DNA_ID=CAMNT_0006967137 /DNA_START=38 /DNA_END=892 /DNA_ORIENTATION=+
MTATDLKNLPTSNVSKWRQRLNDADHGPRIFVEEVEETDVLLGKQRDAFNHVGNRNFRDLIHDNWERYNNSKGRCERTAIVVQIVKFLRDERQVRFLKKDTDVGKWFIVHDSVAREKVGHAIRDAINFRRHHDRKIAEARKKGIDVTEMEQQGRMLPEARRPSTTKNKPSRPLKKRRKKNTPKTGEITSSENIAEILGALKRDGTTPCKDPYFSGSVQHKSSYTHGFGPIPNGSHEFHESSYGSTTILVQSSAQSSGVEESAMMGAFNVWAAQSFANVGPVFGG